MPPEDADWRARAERAESIVDAVIKAVEPEIRCCPETVAEAVHRTTRFAMDQRRRYAEMEARAEKAELELAGAFGDDSYRDAWALIIGARRFEESILDTVRRLVRTADRCWKGRLETAAREAAQLADQLKRYAEEV